VPDEQEIRRQPAHSPVPVAEGVDSLETSMEVGNEHHRMLAVGRPSIGIAQPVGDERRHLRKRRRRHPTCEGTDVVLPDRVRLDRKWQPADAAKVIDRPRRYTGEKFHLPSQLV